MNSVIFVLLVFLGSNQSVKAVISEPVVITENEDSDLKCEAVALKMLQSEKDILKFDYACLPPPDFDQDLSAEDTIELMKKDILNHSA